MGKAEMIIDAAEAIREGKRVGVRCRGYTDSFDADGVELRNDIVKVTMLPKVEGNPARTVQFLIDDLLSVTIRG